MKYALGNMLNGAGVRGLDADALAYITAVEVADGQSLESAVKTAINRFIKGCKGDGIWDEMKASCILAGARTLSGALVPLKGTLPTNFNFVSSDYSRTTGLKGNGSTKYISSNRNNNADPQNSRHLYAYLTGIDTTAVSNTWYIGSGFTNGGSYVAKNNASGTIHIFRSSGGNLGRTVSGAVGGWGVGRSDSSNVLRLAAGSLDSIISASSFPANNVVGVFSATGGLNPTNARISFYSIGESLDFEAFDSRVSTLMSDLTAAIP
jgi:hypothetical protein